MGTVVSYRVRHSNGSDSQIALAIDRSTAELRRLDDMFSTWKPESPMSRFRRGELDTAELPAEISTVLELSGKAKELTQGWFDPWALPGGVDPTGLVKGWAIERAAVVLQEQGVLSALVNGGGDICAIGPGDEGGEWRVGIRHPWKSEALAGVIRVSGGSAVATSGSYERAGQLIDPFAGAADRWSHLRAISVTVTGPVLSMADAFATAAAAAGVKGGAMVDALVGEGYQTYR
ncbi:MAG: FAD:protein FMN transferase, partial [Acidimicrobiales bacterium]